MINNNLNFTKMRHLRKNLLTLLVIAGFSNINAQDANSPCEIDFGVNAVVFYPMSSITSPSIKNYVGGFVNISKDYNYYGLPVKLHIGRYIDKGLSVGISLSTNKIRKMGNLTDELNYFSFDTDLKYDLNRLFGDLDFINNVVVDSYVLTGIGYTSVGSKQNGSLNIGGGINFWVSKSKDFGFQFQSLGKLRLKGTVGSYFQHSFGVVFKFGGPDTDGDGIYDKFDKCPDVAGLKEFNGCPDTDGDGIKDSEDSCPNVAGLKELNGCPDADGDGIADKDDSCPNVAGSKANNGCPDTDGDGIVDKDDSCPNVAGPAANKGCPWPDTDGDGVLDKDDNCADVVGPASNNGCPEEVISAAAEKQLSDFAKTINFNSNRFSFKTGVSVQLDAIVSIMKEFDRANFSINGYTDSTGVASYNQKLSEKRANAVLKYLTDHGIAADRLSSKGFGEENPIDNTNTSKGRANNRCVEIKVVNKK